MGKTDTLLTLGVLGGIGIGAYMLITNMGGIGGFLGGGISDFFSGLLGGGRVRQVTEDIRGQTSVIQSLTDQIKTMRDAFKLQTEGIQAGLGRVQILAEQRMLDIEQLRGSINTIQEQRMTREIKSAIEKQPSLVTTKTATLEWLIRHNLVKV